MAKIKALFYLPLRDNDGRDLSAETEEVRTELYVRFVGWTFLGYIKGAYRMASGNQSVDESGAYVVVLDESRVGELEQVLRDFKAKTTQEAIYLEIQRDVDVRFI
jgi:lipid A disaccharide synthetase